MGPDLCIGGAQIGMPYGIANTTGQPDRHEIVSIIRLAMETGICFYDTGQSYGTSESLLGQAFTELEINNRVKCITKIHPDIGRRDSSELLEGVRRSVERLQVPRLWALLAHREEQAKDPDIAAAVKYAKQEELVGLWGVSVYHPGAAMAYLKDPTIDIIQVPCNILDRRWFDLGFFETARQYGKKVMIRSVFLQGLLFLSIDELAAKGMDWAAPAMRVFRTRFDALEVPLESFALQALLRNASENMVVLGVETSRQLARNIESLRSPVIPTDMIDAWWQALPDFPERLLNPSTW